MDYTKLIDDLRLKSILVDAGMCDPIIRDAADAIEELLSERENLLYNYREEIIRTLHKHKMSIDMRDRYADYGMGFSEAFKIVCMMPLPEPPPKEVE